MSNQEDQQPLDGYSPVWLRNGLIAGGLPWTAALSVDLPDFLARYTLHDSIWLGNWTSSFETTIVIRWDTNWHSDVLPYPSSFVATWPILLIQFERAYQVAIVETTAKAFQIDETITAAKARRVAVEQREALLALSLEQNTLPDAMRDLYLDDELIHTVLQGVYGRDIHIYHRPAVHILCLSAAGEVIPVPWPAQPLQPIAKRAGG